MADMLSNGTDSCILLEIEEDLSNGVLYSESKFEVKHYGKIFIVTL